MSPDITPVVPAGRQLIQGYGDGGFTIAGVRHSGSVVVLPGATSQWLVASLEEIDFASFGRITGSEPPTDILIFGGGATLPLVPRPLREALRATGIVIEPMNTGAACRTFNVLLSEERRVAAALIAVD